MAGERAGHSLQATALVNEAHVRLMDVQRVNCHNLAHFVVTSARLSGESSLTTGGGHYQTFQATAEVPKVSSDTVMRDWSLAKVWLTREPRRDRTRETQYARPACQSCRVHSRLPT
jgi:hypothetical protein